MHIAQLCYWHACLKFCRFSDVVRAMSVSASKQSYGKCNLKFYMPCDETFIPSYASLLV